jgi:hypothetical protein
MAKKPFLNQNRIFFYSLVILAVFMFAITFFLTQDVNQTQATPVNRLCKAGFHRCSITNKCVKSGEICAMRKASTTDSIVGNDRDSHGCFSSAGYSWCGSKGKCLRPFEEKCAKTGGVPSGKAENAVNK